MLATAILITKEKEYPKEVLDSLPPFDEVIIETECPNILRRYELALKARNDLIYVQDDDCVVDVLSLREQYNGELTNFITEHHYYAYLGTDITLIGFGAFFPKKAIDFTRYLDVYGVSELFLTQADRVFTYLNKPRHQIITNVQHLPSATADDRMSTTEGHWDNLENIKRQLHDLPESA